ncbi:MAG: nicotinamide mononucleotide transporter [Flavobacteriaceae bacterium]|nr:nicotinamide mononucleotide transporter [Flavobacteriaceae bacterium]|tara:strand:+ start:60 stop:680 length:621 start_codon:yes stop_codon:yes gene_type:complete
MGEVYDFFLNSYSDYSRVDIILEFLAFWFGIISVVFAKKQNILVYPTGIICTIITMYLMYKVSLLGHILVNLLYTIISFFGWWNWSRKENNDLVVKVSKFTSNDLSKSLLIFFFIVFVAYFAHDFFATNFEGQIKELDILTSGIFVTAMWLMANKKLENWILWIIGNVITIPLYLSSDKIILSIQYVIFTILAIQAYIEWKKSLSK